MLHHIQTRAFCVLMRVEKGSRVQSRVQLYSRRLSVDSVWEDSQSDSRINNRLR